MRSGGTGPGAGQKRVEEVLECVPDSALSENLSFMEAKSKICLLEVKNALLELLSTAVGPGWAENNRGALGFSFALYFLLNLLFCQKVKSLVRENALRIAVGDRGKAPGYATIGHGRSVGGSKFRHGSIIPFCIRSRKDF
jgi:hypothetical protein